MLPCGITTRLAPLAISIGSTILNGAPVGITALNAPPPTLCRDTISGNGSRTLPPSLSDVSAGNPVKIPVGRLLRWLPYRFRLRRAVIPEKSPGFRDEIPLFLRLRVLIAATSASVTLAASVALGTAATIASRTSGVRSITGRNPALLRVSLTSITLTITVIVSESSSSSTVMVSV